MFERLVDQQTEYRLGVIADAFDPAETGRVGKVIRTAGPLAYSEAVGRGKGSFMKAFPELKGFRDAGYTPGRIRKSIESTRSTALRRDIFEAARREVVAESGDELLGYMDAHPLEAIEAAGFKLPKAA